MSEALVKEVSIDRLCRRRALTSRDDHLAIGGRNATGGIQTLHACSHALINFDLAVTVQLCPQLLRQAGMKNITARGENVIDFHPASIFEKERLNFCIVMFDIANFFLVHWNLVLAQPPRVLLVPTLTLAVRRYDDAGRIIEHAEGVLDGLIARANDGNSVSADAIPITIFAEKHAMPETFSYSRYLRRNVKDARCDEETLRPVVTVFALTKENVLVILHRHNFIFREFDMVMFGLFAPEFQKVGAVHSLWESKIIFHFRFPLRHRMTGINHESVPLGTSEIDCGRQPGDAAADNDHFSHTPVTQISWFDPFAHIRLFVAGGRFDRVRSGSIVRV